MIYERIRKKLQEEKNGLLCMAVGSGIYFRKLQ